MLYGRRFLDLYAGSGAVGLEAASRGAEHVLLVESDPKAARVIRQNIAPLGAGDVVTLAAQRVTSALVGGPPLAATNKATAFAVAATRPARATTSCSPTRRTTSASRR